MQDTATMDPPSIRDSGTPRRLFNFGRVLESELTSTGQKQLVRLRSLLAEDLAQQVVYRCRSIEALADDQQTKYFAGDSSQDNPELKVMQQRYEQRKVSAALFEKLILRVSDLQILLRPSLGIHSLISRSLRSGGNGLIGSRKM